MERRESEAGEEDEDTCEEEEVDEEESRALGSSSEDGIHSHVSRSENLE